MANPAECGYLYIIKSEDGPVKIGISIKPEKRICDIETSSGRTIVQTFISPRIPGYYQVEQTLHAKFKDQRIRGEWFNISFRDAVLAANQLGARSFPHEWRQTEDYLQGASHRDRIRQFAAEPRSAEDWSAFNLGMGTVALAQAELADDVDMQASLIGMAQLQLIVDAGIANPIMQKAANAIMADCHNLRAELDADMASAGLK